MRWAWASYKSRVVDTVVAQAFQNPDPSRALPNSQKLADAAVVCGHTHDDDATKVLHALGQRVKQFETWRAESLKRSESADRPTGKTKEEYDRFTRKLDKVANFLEAPRRQTIKDVAAALKRLTGPPPPTVAQPALVSTTTALALAPPVSQAQEHPIATLPPPPPPVDAILNARVRIRDNDCARCEVARDKSADGRAARLGFSSDAGKGYHGKERQLDKVRACPLAAHGIIGDQIEQLIRSHPDGAKLSAPARKRKAAEYMSEKFGVEPLGAPTGKWGQRQVTLYEKDEDGKYQKVNGTGSNGRHRDVYMGFRVAEHSGEASSSADAE